MDRPPDSALFNESAWRSALEKYGAVTHLTITLHGRDGAIVCGPVHPTPLFEVFDRHGYQPGILAECARRCLAQTEARPAVIVAPSSGIAVVGTSLVLEGEIVGAAVAGYALVDFCQSSAIHLLAREAGIPFETLWQIARKTQPVPQRRLVLQGELLQILGDAILRENCRARQYEESIVQLTAEGTAKDEFLAMLGHELRNPLGAISSAAWVLGASGPFNQKDPPSVIARQVKRLTRMVDDLLDISRLNAGKIKLDRWPVDLKEIAGHAVGSLDAAGRTREHEISLHGEPAYVEGDPARLEQILDNLLDNAVKYTPPGGRIAVHVESEGQSCLIRVRDNGMGLDPDMLSRIFDLFVQADRSLDRSRGGLGLGLTLVKRLVELHGGSVSAASAGAGRGTEIVVHLPRLLDAGPIAARGDRPSPAVAGARIQDSVAGARRVLVVEDNEDTREMMHLMLELKGHEVHVAADGVQGVEAALRLEPDIALVDVGLPELDGHGVARAIRASVVGKRIYLVALTGYGRPEDRRRAFEAGFDTHLVKPVDPDRLADIVCSAPRNAGNQLGGARPTRAVR